MKNVMIAAVALVVGLVLGGLSPRAEVRRLEAQVTELKKEHRPMLGTELAEMLTRRPAPPVPDAPDAQPVPDVPAPTEDAPAPDELVPGSDVPPLDTEPQTPQQSLDLMREAMEVRRSQAWESLRQDLDPTEEQLADIDAAVADMNAELRSIAEDMLERVRPGEEPSRRDLMYLGADTLDAFIAADERISATLGPDLYDAAQPESVDPLSYVDPALLDLLEGLDR